MSSPVEPPNSSSDTSEPRQISLQISFQAVASGPMTFMRPMTSGTLSNSVEESLRSFFTNPENLSRLINQNVQNMSVIRTHPSESAEASSDEPAASVQGASPEHTAIPRLRRTVPQAPADLFRSMMSEIFASFQTENKATAKATLDALPKIILKNENCGEDGENEDELKVKELKSRLDFLGISYAGFVEKSEFLNALRSSLCVGPGACSDAGCPSCTICMAEFESGDRVTKLPCGHWFHCGHAEEGTDENEEGDACPGVVKWLAANSTCPNCKHQLPKESDAPRSTAATVPPPSRPRSTPPPPQGPAQNTRSSASTHEPAPKRRRR